MSFPAVTNAGPAQALGTPDTCNTPAPSGVLPTPYPNIAMSSQGNGGTLSKVVKIVSGAVFTTSSQCSMSSGDEAGTAGGVASGQVMGPASFKVGSVTVMIEGNPCVRLTSTSGHNGASSNVPGTVIAPSQAQVLVS